MEVVRVIVVEKVLELGVNFIIEESLVLDPCRRFQLLVTIGWTATSIAVPEGHLILIFVTVIDFEFTGAIWTYILEILC